MISNKLPQQEVVEQIPKEPFNWIPVIIIIACIAIVVIMIIDIIIIRKHYKKKYCDYNETKKMRKAKSNNESYKVICMGFKQFHDYYSLNPERYKLDHAKVMVYTDDYLNEVPGLPWSKTYSHCIIFKLKDYKKYREWIEKSTNGMQDPRAVTDTLGFLEVVESDIKRIREREAIAVNEAQKTMQEVTTRLKEEYLDLEKDSE